MLAKAVSSGLHGIDAQTVEIEVDIIKGLPGFTIVGLPDSTIRESRERIRSAIENSGYQFPPQNFIVNLAPAGFKKEGPNYDLPIAASILSATGQEQTDTTSIPMVGELSLDGSVKPVRGAISMAIALYRSGFRKMIVPFENRHEAAAISELEVYPVRDIRGAFSALNGETSPFRAEKSADETPRGCLDFSDVRGQETAKRAMEIAAAGHHNILLYGSPGSGKTMLARRIQSILPSLNRDQSIETTMIHSAGGKLKNCTGLVSLPPFRSPHHTSSDVSLVGGGRVPVVGEISLAHNGILFMDEFVEFNSNVIQALRQPLEDFEITVSRAAGSFLFPADFMLVAASNPCRCGYLFDREIPCTCRPHMVSGYFQKISGPIIDRIDMEVLVDRVPYKDLMGAGIPEKSKMVRNRVTAARQVQKQRFTNSATRYNSRMTTEEIKKFCPISNESGLVLESAIKRMNLTARSFYKIIKVSRTIADLEGCADIEKKHVLEALSYKNLQRNYSI